MVILTEGSDLDSLSSAYALTLLEKDTYILFPYSYSSTVKLAVNYFKEKLKNKILKKENVKNLKKIYIVDTSSMEKIKQALKENKLENFKNITVIDHHEKIKLLPDNFKKIPVSYGACTTYFVKKIKRKKLIIDKEDATLLALGIYEDTGLFKYSNTTKDDVDALKFLVEIGLEFDIINDILTNKIDEKSLKILETAIENLHIWQIKNKKIGISRIFCKDYIPDISGYLNNLKKLHELNAFFLLIISKNKTFIIARSKDINVNEILSAFGGGGHKRAASALIKDIEYEEIEDELEILITKHLLKDETVEKFIIKEFTKVNINEKIENLEEIQDYFLFAVDHENNFKGIVFTRTIKNALKHGIKNLKIKDVLIDDIFIFENNTPVYEAEKTALKASQDIFPVLKNDKPIGYLTKRSLLGAIHLDAFQKEENVFISRIRLTPKMYNFKEKLERYFPLQIIKVLKEVGKTAKDLNMKIYLVGGIVRDIVMQRENLDIDLIVEGDAVELAKEFSQKVKGKFHKFEEFMTAQIKIDSLKLDFATARKEIYEYPGAYPKVEKSTLKEDLYRRDFTINTLAIDITENSFGMLIDYFNGLQDIKNQKIRILHQLSFIEDPIRIFRALRFAGRFDFSLGKYTEKLLKVAVDQNLIKAAASGRINLELNLTFNEEKVVEILALMHKYKVLQQLIPYFEMTEEKLIILERIRDYYSYLTTQFDIKINKSSVYLLGLMYHLPLEISTSILEKFHFENAIKIFEEFFEIKDRITNKLKNSQLYKLLKEINPETTLFLIAFMSSELSQKIIDILSKSKTKIITGKDLINLGMKPSKQFSQIIAQVQDLYLDNKIKSKEEALNFVKKKFL